MNCRKGFPGKLNRNSSEENIMYGTKPQTVSHFSSEVVEEGNGVYEGTMSRRFEGYYWLVQSKSKQFLNNRYSVRMKESQMPFNRLMFFSPKGSVCGQSRDADVEAERRVQCPVSAAELQTKRGLLDQVSL